jgi:arginyl-tRNA synthetase
VIIVLLFLKFVSDFSSSSLLSLSLVVAFFLLSLSLSQPNGFINIKLATNTMISSISSIVSSGVKPPKLPSLKVLVDFSSPNIAKEMHVGHLRSTIIGDCMCRLLEFVQFDVMRVNHLGDWGTQFGMLITYLLEAFPNILQESPNISDLTAIYKSSKKRFDEDTDFKERSRLNVVKLQSHDPICYKIWQLLCEVSRQEFAKVYSLLDVTLDEYGESYYNPMIPSVIENLRNKGLVEEDEGMLVIKLPHFTIPLIVRKSDGGYGYDSTDMAALHYRLFELKRDWIIIITDAGQAPHFHMIFDAGKEAGWFKEVAETRSVQSLASLKEGRNNTAGNEVSEEKKGLVVPRVDHIGFGVVCGDDGKRFKTRSSETVRLIDLLNAARDRMKESLLQRASEGKAGIATNELDDAAAKIGYGAVKYFDLKQHPSTDYIFNYDRMLDTKGDTAVYLMFAYARLASILRKVRYSFFRLFLCLIRFSCGSALCSGERRKKH